DVAGTDSLEVDPAGGEHTADLTVPLGIEGGSGFTCGSTGAVDADRFPQRIVEADRLVVTERWMIVDAAADVVDVEEGDVAEIVEAAEFPGVESGLLPALRVEGDAACPQRPVLDSGEFEPVDLLGFVEPAALEVLRGR